MDRGLASMRPRDRLVLCVLFAIGMGACVDHVVGPSPGVPIASDYPNVASRFVVQPATASDSRVPAIIPAGDSVFVTMVVPAICGQDTVIAGAAHDSLVVTLRRRLLPLPCAFIQPDVRVGAAVAIGSNHRVVVSVDTRDFQDTTRALVASAVLGRPQLSSRD
jgi:hypothetical protein